MAFSPYALTLDTVTFTGMEIPERLEWASVQALVDHDYPGGVRTQQTFGTLPKSPMQWSGMLRGSTALSRSDELQQLADTPDQRTLTYGPEAWTGRVGAYAATVRHQWLVAYSIEFHPIARLRTGPQAESALDSAGGLDSIVDLHLLALQGLVSGNTPGTGLMLALYAPSLAGPVGTLVGNAYAALQATPGGSVADLSAAQTTSLQANCATVISAAAPIIAANTASPVASAPAAEASYRATALSVALGQGGVTRTYLQTINPNLPQLAAQYLGDSSRWQEIATLNNLALDPLPIGAFRLSIPAA